MTFLCPLANPDWPGYVVVTVDSPQLMCHWGPTFVTNSTGAVCFQTALCQTIQAIERPVQPPACGGDAPRTNEGNDRKALEEEMSATYIFTKWKQKWSSIRLQRL